MGSLAGLLCDLRDGRELLRNSYILAYFLSWDDRRRCICSICSLTMQLLPK